MDALSSLALRHKIKIIEDAAQSFGASYRGRIAGSFGDIACFSMNPMKVFAACGEAGVVLTDDANVYERLVALRYNGTINKERCIETSLNCRLDTIQAAVLLQRLQSFDALIQKRREIAQIYGERLARFVRVPKEQAYEKDVYYTYQIQTPKRDLLKQYLDEKGVETKIQHPFLMCQQPIYQKLLKKPVVRAERIVQEILCIPIHEKLSRAEVEHVIDSVESFFHA
jgi:dTDP-4-amino-4,6-dideoxygalactose transaminase